jgi:hypothetical protein
MKGYFSYDANFVSEGKGVAISTQSNVGFFLALGSNHSVDASDFGVVKTLESFLNL